MSDIERFVTIWGGVVMNPASSGNWVRYDDHRAEVERLKEQVAALTVAVEQADEMKAHAEAAAAAEEAETDRVMSERDAAQAEVERLTQELDGRRASNQRIIAERDLAQGERERLQDLLRCERQELSTLRERLRQLQADPSNQLDKARAQVEWLKYQVATLTGAVEQANKAKADAEAAAAMEEAETDRVVADGNKALAEVERLTVERNKAKAVEWLRANQSAQNLDMVANCKETLTSSRPTDEDIWREAFMSQLHDVLPNWATTADAALAEYRKRWPR